MKNPIPDTKTWCIGKAEFKDYDVIRTIRTTLNWTSYAATDKSGKRVTLTFMDSDRMLERYKFFDYQKGKSLEEAEAAARERILKNQHEIASAVERVKGLGSEHVAATYGCSMDRERNQFVVISEYTPGIELTHAAKQLNPQQQIFLFAQILKGLIFIHKNNFLHLNVKPSRIFVDTEQHPPVAKLTNFGFAIPKSGYTGELTGTPFYISPEVALNKRELIGESSDIYSSGVTMYKCLTGRDMFEQRIEAEADRQKLASIIEREVNVQFPPSHYNKNVPKELDEIVMAFVEKDAAKRIYTASNDSLGAFLTLWPKGCAEMMREGTTALAF